MLQANGFTSCQRFTMHNYDRDRHETRTFQIGSVETNRISRATTTVYKSVTHEFRFHDTDTCSIHHYTFFNEINNYIVTQRQTRHITSNHRSALGSTDALMVDSSLPRDAQEAFPFDQLGASDFPTYAIFELMRHYILRFVLSLITDPLKYHTENKHHHAQNYRVVFLFL